MNVHLDMVGCRLNQAEIESYARQLQAAGHNLVPSAAAADLVVVNTCSVTGAAASDSRQKIRHSSLTGAAVVATGCWASLEPEAAAALPGVRQVIPNDDKDALVEIILKSSNIDPNNTGRVPVAGKRNRKRAFIKIQDGCDNYCTYCVTRLARGSSRSISVNQVVADVNHAITGGAQEAILTGVQIGAWGRDLQPAAHLADLLHEVMTRTTIPRLRISSIEPWEVDDRLISLWRDPRLCRHFHLPLQSGAPAVLRRMARRTTTVDFQLLVEKLRQAIPGVSITTDIIVGFPGEDEAAFEETCRFVERLAFSAGHVFVYSARPGTPAAGYVDQVPFPIRRQRSRILRELFARQAGEFQSAFPGQLLDVLWQRSIRKPGGWLSSGFSDNYIKVVASTPEDRTNKIDRVLVHGTSQGVLTAEVLGYENEIIATA
jgi:threonylcarbamoyladenosine tRNA methylthiotransferase MtaB